MSTVLAGRASTLERMSLLNLASLEPDLAGALELDQRTAALVPSGLSSSTKIASQAMPAKVASSRATMGATLAASL